MLEWANSMCKTEFIFNVCGRTEFLTMQHDWLSKDGSSFLSVRDGYAYGI